MKHYGDITKLNGAELPVVDCITGGSPCQDLSVAGKRAGLEGERSGLFMEQIRIVKEMREHDRSSGRAAKFVRPRYLVWENVCGVLSASGGKDFQAVLTEIVRIAEPNAPDVPLFKRWGSSGCLYDDMGSWSIAWRVHDTQFWGATQYVDGRMLLPGTPQRRKRIALVADFGGLSAPEVLFEREGMSWDPEPEREKGETTAGASRECVEETSGIALYDGSRRHDYKEFKDVSETVQAQYGTGGNNQPLVVYRKTAHPRNSEMPQGFEETEVSDTLNIFDNTEARTPTIVYENHSQDSRYRPLGDTCETVNAKYGTGGNNQPLVVQCVGNGQSDLSAHITDDVSQTPNCMNDPMAILTYQDKTGTLSPGAHAGSYNGQDAYTDMLIANQYGSSIRRLTPTECELLQGFPKNWTNIGEWKDTKGKIHKPADSPRYKALGNAIAIPFWFVLLRRISAQYERPATLGSLFDGIGGFPLCWERCNGPGTAIWASEIEEFPIAVTKKHFPEEGEEKEGK